MKLKILSTALLVSLTACSTPTVVSTPKLSLQVNPSTALIGQKISATLGLQNASGTWHIALFAEDPAGNVDQVLPNRLPGGDLTLTNGQVTEYPSAAAQMTSDAAGPAGVTTFLMYASKQPLDLTGISAYNNDTDRFAALLPSHEGIGSLEGSTLTALSARNPGIYTTAKLTIKRPNPL